ncbi:PspC domain-containing protein [Nocardiopsis algeriensis]|uniref:PspC domain-containing protein n=1 Tax=Nocardiopsis algeriensis TaxID=1478215 RepID=UPI003B436150
MSEEPAFARPGPDGSGVAAETVSPDPVLRKGDDDRVLAGVCAGLGRYTGIDPVVWRTGFVLTAFGGAAGVILYVGAWMTMRDAQGGPATVEQMLNRSIPSRAVPKLLGVGLAVATAFSLVGGFGWSTLVLAVPLVVGVLAARNRGVDLRAAFAELRDDLASEEPPPQTPAPGPKPAYYNPAQPWASAQPGPVDLAAVAERVADVEAEEDEPAGQPGPERCRGRGAPLGSLALWVLVVAGVLSSAAVLGWSSVWSTQTVQLLLGPGTGVFFLSGALAVVGVFAVVGTWAGSTRGLFLIGTVLTALLMLVSVTDLTQARLGQEVWRPGTVAEAEAGNHRLHGGTAVLDLTGMEDLGPGEEVDVSLRVDTGRTELLLPGDARVELSSRVGAGAVYVGSPERTVAETGFGLLVEEDLGAVEGGAGKSDDPPVVRVSTVSAVGVVEVRHGEA